MARAAEAAREAEERAAGAAAHTTAYQDMAQGQVGWRGTWGGGARGARATGGVWGPSSYMTEGQVEMWASPDRAQGQVAPRR